MKTENLLQGSILKTIYVVAAPTMLHMLLETSYQIIDAIWIGMLGPLALAAVASSSFLVWLISELCGLVRIGVNSLTARAVGGKDQKMFHKVSSYGIRCCILFSFLIMVIGVFFVDDVFKTMGLKFHIGVAAKSYFIPIVIGLPLYAMMVTKFAIFRGLGDTKTPLKIIFVMILLNSLLTPTLMFGIGFFPEMGITGAAVASVFSHLFAVVVSFIALKKANYLPHSTKKFIELKIAKQILKIGIPISLNGVFFAMIYLFLTRIAIAYGTAPIAALGIGHRVESLPYCLCVGFSIAATTLVAQNLGAKNYARARYTAWGIAGAAAFTAFLISIAMIVLRHEIASVFTKDPLVLAACESYLFIIGFSEVFMALEIIMGGIFSGLGYTIPTTITGLPLNILRIPLAYFLAKYYGMEGIWWAIALTTILKGSFLCIWLKLREKKLLQPENAITERLSAA